MEETDLPGYSPFPIKWKFDKMGKYCLLDTVIHENGKKSYTKWEILVNETVFDKYFTQAS